MLYQVGQHLLIDLLLSALLLQTEEKWLIRFYPQPLDEAFNRPQGGIPLAAFDLADDLPFHARQSAKPLLGQPFGLPELLDPGPELGLKCPCCALAHEG